MDGRGRWMLRPERLYVCSTDICVSCAGYASPPNHGTQKRYMNCSRSLVFYDGYCWLRPSSSRVFAPLLPLLAAALALPPAPPIFFSSCSGFFCVGDAATPASEILLFPPSSRCVISPGVRHGKMRIGRVVALHARAGGFGRPGGRAGEGMYVPSNRLSRSTVCWGKQIRNTRCGKDCAFNVETYFVAGGVFDARKNNGFLCFGFRIDTEERVCCCVVLGFQEKGPATAGEKGKEDKKDDGRRKKEWHQRRANEND